MQRERRLQQERLLNSFTTALNSFQSAQRKQKDRETAHRASHSRRQPAFVSLTSTCLTTLLRTSCAGSHHNMLPPPATLTFWPWKWCPESRLTWATSVPIFSLPWPLCSQLRPDVCDRHQTASSLNAPSKGRGYHKTIEHVSQICEAFVAVSPALMPVPEKKMGEGARAPPA